MKRYIITSIILLIATLGYSQDFYDVIRYAQTNTSGTARSISMGSAFGALGADFSSASINPAGLGFYRSGEFTFSPTLNIDNVESSYLGTNVKDNRIGFNFNNMSYVGNVKTGSESGIVDFSFGIGFNRLKNYNSRFLITGHGAQTSLLDYYTDWANSIGNSDNFDGFNEGMAWKSYLIDQDPDESVIEGTFYNDLTDYSKYEIYDANNEFLGYGYKKVGIKPHTQQASVSQSGRIDEYLLSMGFNVNHKFYFGASVGLLDLQFNQSSTFSEIDDENKSDYFQNYTLSSDMSHSGAGVNFKAGIIYRPFKSLRIGAAIHTPNLYSISYYEERDMDANYDKPVGNDTEGRYTNWSSMNNYETYKYRLQTPMKAVVSVAYLFGNRGLLSVDYDYSNYASNRFSPAVDDNYDYSAKNEELRNVFKSAGNLHIGGEFRLTPNFSLRGGYELFGNPWKSSTTSNGTTLNLANANDSYSTYSAGFGYRQQNFFIDFAYRMIQSSQAYVVHDMTVTDSSYGMNVAQLKGANNQATVTFGFRF